MLQRARTLTIVCLFGVSAGLTGNGQPAGTHESRKT
jgi:hypothetical protein